MRLDKFRDRVMKLAIKHLLFGSPLLWAMTLVFLVRLIFKGAAESLSSANSDGSKKGAQWPDQ